jgi:DNA-binding XRE family transcriptional regulator
MSRRKTSRRWIEPLDFQDLRKRADLTRKQAAGLLDVTTRTVQNWETGGARIPWMAYRMLRILTGYALPGKAWEGWTVHGDRLIAPNGRWYEANTLEQIEHVFGMARLWHQDYVKRCKWPAAVVLPFPALAELRKTNETSIQLKGGTR